MFNHQIEWRSEELEKDWEGCLSIPGMEEVVTRPWAVRVEGVDPEGNPLVIEADDLYSRALQHEIDHLSGVLLLDRLGGRLRSQALKELREESISVRRSL